MIYGWLKTKKKLRDLGAFFVFDGLSSSVAEADVIEQ